MIQEKAVIFAKELNIENFQASDGWLRRWKEKNNISFKTVSGVSKSVTPEMVNAWSETSLPTLFSNYDLKDIYNVDEFGLFYQYLPNTTYQLKSEKCYGGKLSKINITGMATVNAMGSNFPCSSLGRPRIHDASKMSSFYLNTTGINEKVGWIGNCLKSGSESWTRSLLLKEEMLLL